MKNKEITMMGYVGDAEKDLCIQRAFCIMRNRKYDIQLKDWYVVLSYIVRKRGEEALYEYAKTIDLRDSKNEKARIYSGMT